MPSRRNFMLGIGSILSGGSTFLGSGAFSPDPDSRMENYVSVETRARSTGQQFSLGTDAADEPDDTGPPPDDDQPDDQTDDGNDDQPDDQTDDGNDDQPDDERDSSDDGDDGGGGSSERVSIRLQASGPDVLDSPHVRTDGSGELAGIVLERANKRARTYIGETSDARFPNPREGDRVAFLVVNDGTVPVRLGVDVDGTAIDVFGLPSFGPSGQRRNLTAETVRRLEPGETIHAVVEIDTTGVGTVPDDAVEQITVVAMQR